MKRARYFVVDAFATAMLRGNPAGVCLLETWWTDATLQAIAEENNLAETAFLVRSGERFELRWFTPTMEVDLCGHATLASAHVLIHHTGHAGDRIEFVSKSGTLAVARAADYLELDFPARPPQACALSAELARGLGKTPAEVYKAHDYYLTVFATEAEVRALRPEMNTLLQLDGIGVIASAPGDRVDFVSRFFAPKAGVAEDPVTGSAHCTLTPYWSRRLGKRSLVAHQVSRRGGELLCEDRGARVGIAGHCETYLQGEITWRN